MATRSGFKVQTLTARGGSFAAAGQLLSTLVFNASCGKHHGSRRWSLVLEAPIRVICATIQIIAFVVDRLVPDYSNTLGYGIVAKKGELDYYDGNEESEEGGRQDIKVFGDPERGHR